MQGVVEDDDVDAAGLDRDRVHVRGLVAEDLVEPFFLGLPLRKLDPGRGEVEAEHAGEDTRPRPFELLVPRATAERDCPQPGSAA